MGRIVLHASYMGRACIYKSQARFNNCVVSAFSILVLYFYFDTTRLDTFTRIATSTIYHCRDSGFAPQKRVMGGEIYQ